MRAKTRYTLAGAAIAALALSELFNAVNYKSLTLTTDDSDQRHVQTSQHSKTGRAGKGGNDAGLTFHGLDLHYISEAKASSVHCVGDNFLPKTSSGYRSCEFRHLCWDLEDKEFVIFESEQHKHLSELMEQMPSRYARSSSNFNTSVSLSPTTEGRLRTGNGGKWFPRTIPMDNKGYYELPEDVLWVPIQFPMDGDVAAQTEIVFDYFHPVFNLLSMFHLHDKNTLFMNLGPQCSVAQKCYSEALSFLPIMKKLPEGNDAFASPKDYIQWSRGADKLLRSNRICAGYGASGIGGLSDHGIHKKSHGERRKDYTFVQNSGRGPLFFDFRKYALNNLGIPENSAVAEDSNAKKIVVSVS
jgi:hypothetical protein